MALVKEDGTGLPTANAYADASFADTYHASRGHSAWTDASITTADKDAALVRASDHIDRVYGRRFRGRKLTKDQAMEWPRTDAFDDDGFALNGTDAVPRQLQKATAEYALRALLVGVLTPDGPPVVPAQSLQLGATNVVSTDPTGAITSLREKVGPLEVRTTYATPKNESEMLPAYPAADRWLKELLIPRSNPTVSRGD